MIDDLIWRQVCKVLINRIRKRNGNKINGGSWLGIYETLSREIRTKSVNIEDLGKKQKRRKRIKRS